MILLSVTGLRKPIDHYKPWWTDNLKYMVNDRNGGEASRVAVGEPGREPSIHQLRLFLVLAQELHFGRAAKRLFITQPALSRQIRELEDRVGVSLVERSSRAVALTTAGQALLPEARDIVAGMSRLGQSARAHAREASSRLVLGSIGAEFALPHTHAMLGDLRRHHPEITIETRNLSIADHVEALINDEVDVIILRPPAPPGLQTLHLATEPRVACLPADDVLATEHEITLAQLAGYPVVDVPPPAPRAWWDHWSVNPRPDGTPVRYGPVVNDLEALMLAVASGQAMSFLPAAARHMYPRPGVRYVDVSDLSPCTSALAWLPKNRDRPTIAAIREAARRSCGDQ